MAKQKIQTPKKTKKVRALKGLAGYKLAHFAGDEFEIAAERADLLIKAGAVEAR